MAKRKKSPVSGVDPEYLKKQKASLVRKHRQIIYLNRYCEQFRVNAKASLYREAIMQKVLSELDDNPPTLF